MTLKENCENASCVEHLKASLVSPAVICSSIPVPHPVSSNEAMTCAEMCLLPVSVCLLPVMLGESHWFLQRLCRFNSSYPPAESPRGRGLGLHLAWCEELLAGPTFFVFQKFLRVEGVCGQERWAGGVGEKQRSEQWRQGLKRSFQRF